ncbi:MAG: AMP-binding protein [Solirubrobacterales bacterium]|nr:AMP-binding protein [Solirubrobacterales bacterium]
MSTEEAADIIARAVATKPRTIAPLWGRLIGATQAFSRRPLETGLAWWAGGGNAALAGAGRVATDTIRGSSTIRSLGIIRPIRPDRLARAALAQRRFGLTPAFLVAAAAELHPSSVGIIDETGELTFGELSAQTDGLAAALHEHFELRQGQRVAIMCRNHRGFIQAAAAATRLGCDLVPLNSDFAAPQLGDVLGREGVSMIVYDEEFEDVVEESEFEGTKVVAWHEKEPRRATLSALIEAGDDEVGVPLPARPGRMITLTSGTTGTPKGATRSVSAVTMASLALGGFLDLARVDPAPRAGEPIVVPPPLYHLYGMIGMALSFGLGSPLVLRRRFDPEAVLEQIQRTRAGMLLAVPTMLGRIIQLPEEVRARYDTSSLRMIVSGAAPLPPELATAVMDEFGDILYNGYASTEVGSGTLATPRDLRAAPGSVGRPMAGVTVKILDEEGLELPSGQTGRIFIGSPLLFDGYTGGGGKEVIDGAMSTGDVGHFDHSGRLYVDGRDDDMIVSGGENVYPQEVEELLGSHPDVTDAAVFGVSDPDFGQRLVSKVVLKDGGSVSEDELRSYVRERLARYKVPREIEFVDELPRTSTGKLQRRRLADVRD